MRGERLEQQKKKLAYELKVKSFWQLIIVSSTIVKPKDQKTVLGNCFEKSTCFENSLILFGIKDKGSFALFFKNCSITQFLRTNFCIKKKKIVFENGILKKSFCS